MEDPQWKKWDALSKIKYSLELSLRYLLFASSQASESGLMLHTYSDRTDFSGLLDWWRGKKSFKIKLMWTGGLSCRNFHKLFSEWTTVPLQFLYRFSRSSCKIHSSVHLVQGLDGFLDLYIFYEWNESCRNTMVNFGRINKFHKTYNF